MAYDHSEWIDELQLTIAELRAEIDILNDHVSALQAEEITFKNKLRHDTEDAYLRGYKDGRRTASDGGMN
jgi:hypothetical protein